MLSNIKNLKILIYNLLYNQYNKMHRMIDIIVSFSLGIIVSIIIKKLIVQQTLIAKIKMN